MLLANSSVREAAKTARVCRIRHAPLAASLYSLFIQNHCAKSENPWFFKTNSEIVGIALLRSNGRKGRSPFYGCGPAAPFNGSGTAARPRSSSKMDSLAWLRWAGAGRACRRGGKPPWRLAKPMRLPPKFPHMEFCIYPNKMPTHFILPESLIL